MKLIGRRNDDGDCGRCDLFFAGSNCGCSVYDKPDTSAGYSYKPCEGAWCPLEPGEEAVFEVVKIPATSGKEDDMTDGIETGGGGDDK